MASQIGAYAKYSIRIHVAHIWQCGGDAVCRRLGLGGNVVLAWE
jgi:hypothetical protein